MLLAATLHRLVKIKYPSPQFKETMPDIDKDIEIPDFCPGKGRVPKKVISNLYEFYLVGEITGPSDYIEWFDIIRHCTPDDTVKIYINSGGGDLFTAIQFMRVLAESDATIVISVEGLCASAATLVFLCADVFEVTPHSSFLFHNYSSGVWGKGGEQYSQIIHERKWSEKLLKEIYEDFLTISEINAILANGDLWMGVDEVVKRMQERIKIRKELRALEEEEEEEYNQGK